MLLNILKQINWVDIFVLLLVIRVCFVAVKNGFPVELFKLLGTIAAIYLASHYFATLAELLFGWIGLGKVLPLEFLQFVVFLLLAIFGYAVFLLLRVIFHRFLKMEAVSSLNKWGSLFLGAIRGIFLASLIIFMMFISSVSYFQESVKSSYSAKGLFMLSPNTYSWLWNNAVSKFAGKERFNHFVTTTSEEFLKR